MASGGMHSQVAALFLLLGLISITAGHSEARGVGVGSKSVAEVDGEAGWTFPGDPGSDLVLRSLRLEGRRADRENPVHANLQQRSRRLHTSSCSATAAATCSALPSDQQNTIRSNLIASCSNVLPTSTAGSSCCTTLKGSGTQKEYDNNVACLCGGNGGLSAFVPESTAEQYVQQCPGPGGASNPSSGVTPTSTSLSQQPPGPGTTSLNPSPPSLNLPPPPSSGSTTPTAPSFTVTGSGNSVNNPSLIIENPPISSSISSPPPPAGSSGSTGTSLDSTDLAGSLGITSSTSSTSSTTTNTPSSPPPG